MKTTRRSRPDAGRWLVLLACLWTVLPARAWNDHPLVTYHALAEMPEVVGAPALMAESLDAFLGAEAEGIARLLADEEAWARANLTGYPARPDALQFVAAGDPATIRTRFLQALRMNPEVKLPLYLERMPWEDAGERPPLDWQALTFFEDPGRVKRTPYVSLRAGERVSALEVVVTASDEPDMGHDIRVWEDSGTEFGKAYGLGNLPFGNPVLEYATQAPFHMGLYHEAGIIYAAAGFLKRTYPEVRLRQSLALARFAFQRGHAYWGWRFAGWGLHYLQDLTNPYHAQILPGVRVGRMLTINTLAILGARKPRDHAVQLVTNRHLALESYQYYRFLQMTGLRTDDRLAEAVRRAGGDNSYGTFNPTYVRQVLTLESSRRSRAVDRGLERAYPRKYVSDPTYLFETTEPDVNGLEIVKGSGQEAQEQLERILEELLGSFGAHSRNYVRAVLAP